MSSPAASPPLAASWTSSHRGGSSDCDERGFSNDEDELEEESAASGSETEDFTRRTRRRQRIHFNVERLQTVYHLPLKTAAERLGICEAALKRICRRNLIQKWPYRQLSSVRRRLTELIDRRAGMIANHGVEDSTRREVQEYLPLVTPAEFDIKLQQLKEEQDRIIQVAHQPRQPRTSTRFNPTTSCPPYPHERPIQKEEPVIHLHGVRSTIADLPPLDLSRVDREFPLLLLANVCESVRAYT